MSSNLIPKWQYVVQPWMRWVAFYCMMAEDNKIDMMAESVGVWLFRILSVSALGGHGFGFLLLDGWSSE